jgi:tetratricopeptide (TPR) repeat protein
LCFPQPATARQGSWVGKTILVKKPDIKIGHTEEGGRQVYVGKLTGLSYTVLGDKDGFLKVNNGQGAEGWFDKDDAVLLENAVAYFDERIKQNPNDGSAYASRAIAWQLKGDFKNAVKDLGEALRLDPQPYLYLNRGYCWNNQGEYDRGIADLDEAIRLVPDYWLAYANRGVAYAYKKDYDKAISDYNEALRLNPKFGNSYCDRGVVCLHKKEYAKAARDFDQGLNLAPNYTTGNLYKAWLLATCPDAKYRDGKQAVELAKKAIPKDQPVNGKAFAVLAAAHAEAGNFEEAVRFQERALADSAYAAAVGDRERSRLELYRNKKPYRDE